MKEREGEEEKGFHGNMAGTPMCVAVLGALSVGIMGCWLGVMVKGAGGQKLSVVFFFFFCGSAAVTVTPSNTDNINISQPVLHLCALSSRGKPNLMSGDPVEDSNSSHKGFDRGCSLLMHSVCTDIS